LRSIKSKLGFVIVAAVTGTTAVVVLGLQAGLGWIVSALIAAAVGLIFIQFLARGMTSPLREMASAARAMAKGDYDRRVTATSRDEVGELARAFNRMAAELAETDRFRRDLVANVSHELRTPITALRAVLENIVDGVSEADAQTLQTMLTQVERLGRLVEQLLDLSKLEAGVIPLERMDFPLRPVLERVIDEGRVQGQASGRSPRFELVLTDDVVVNGDPERVHQVFANLVDNALRHSPDQAVVTIEAERSNGRVNVSVIDEGPGIAGADAAKVFERFYRSDSSRALADGGTGLGLAIARWIVDLHGGDIKVDQDRPRGCRVVVDLPAA
jgi:signal transduction histidine kinase